MQLGIFWFSIYLDFIYFRLLKAPWLETFNNYHGCDKPSSVHIFHRNGCGPTPQTCANKELFPNMSQIYNMNLDMGFLWHILPNISSISKSSKLNKFSNLLNELVIMNCVIEAREYCLGVRNQLIPLDGWLGSTTEIKCLLNEIKRPCRIFWISLFII